MKRILVLKDEGEESRLPKSDDYELYYESNRRSALDFLKRYSAAAVVFECRPSAADFRFFREQTDLPLIAAVPSENYAAKAYKTGFDDVFFGELPGTFACLLEKNASRYAGKNEKRGGEKTASLGNVSVSLSAYSVSVGEKPVRMPKKELELLYTLLSAPETVFSRDRLLDEIWGVDYEGDGRTVDVHILRIRKKLSENAADIGIKTVHAAGYKAHKICREDEISENTVKNPR